jgi:hypothetical protein
MTGRRQIRIGCGAGYSGDRIEPAVELVEKGNIQYLVFECLAERTIALAQLKKKHNPESGFDSLLEKRMLACLPGCHEKKIRVITNMGAANPIAAAKKVGEIAISLGLRGLKIATVLGDDVYDSIINEDYKFIESGEPISKYKDQIVSANAYLGISPIVEALRNEADVIITGRVADPALFIAPLVFEFGWPLDDFDILGKATVVGHLMECAGQVTGGYFADPGLKEMPDLANLGFPIADVEEDGSFIITKVAGSGGEVTPATCKEQLLYEIHDPSKYYTPDVVADFTSVKIIKTDTNQVRILGGSGKKKTGLLKVSVCYLDGFIGEGQISYAGIGAVQRGELAIEIVKNRLETYGFKDHEARYELIGVDALHGQKLSHKSAYEVRARITLRTSNLEEATQIGDEVETLYTNGPAGGSGVSKQTREVIAVQSILIDESEIDFSIKYMLS